MTAHELTTAAGKLRACAAMAKPGPWAVSRIPGIGRTVNDPTGDFSLPIGTSWVSQGDGAWIALAHPGLAEPLAELLDTAQALIEEIPSLEHGHVEGGPCPDLACAFVFHARALSRLINGSEP